MRKLLIRKNKDKKYVAAITTIELVLILVILIALLLIFKEQLISLITTIFEKVTSESSGTVSYTHLYSTMKVVLKNL